MCWIRYSVELPSHCPKQQAIPVSVNLYRPASKDGAARQVSYTPFDEHWSSDVQCGKKIMAESTVRYFRLTHDLPFALNAGCIYSLEAGHDSASCNAESCPADLCTMPLSPNPHHPALNAAGIIGEPKCQWHAWAHLWCCSRIQCWSSDVHGFAIVVEMSHLNHQTMPFPMNTPRPAFNPVPRRRVRRQMHGTSARLDSPMVLLPHPIPDVPTVLIQQAIPFPTNTHRPAFNLVPGG